MEKKLMSVLMAGVIAMVVGSLAGCGDVIVHGTPDKPRQVLGGSAPQYWCIEGFTYVTWGHGLAPVFDKEDRLPKQCEVKQ